MNLRSLYPITPEIYSKLKTRKSDKKRQAYIDRVIQNNTRNWLSVCNKINRDDLRTNGTEGLLILKDKGQTIIKSIWIRVYLEPRSFGTLVFNEYMIETKTTEEIQEYIDLGILGVKDNLTLKIDIFDNKILMVTTSVDLKKMKEIGIKNGIKMWPWFIINNITVYDTAREKLNRIKSYNYHAT